MFFEGMFLMIKAKKQYGQNFLNDDNNCYHYISHIHGSDDLGIEDELTAKIKNKWVYLK